MKTVKTQQLLTLLHRKTELLTKYQESLSSVLELLEVLKYDETGNIDMMMENHTCLINLITNLIDEIDKQASYIVLQLQADQSAVIKSILQCRLSEQHCPLWAKEVYQVVQHHQRLLRDLGELNKRTILKTQDIIDYTREQLKKTNQRKAANNYYANLGQKQIGFLLDLKDNHHLN